MEEQKFVRVLYREDDTPTGADAIVSPVKPLPVTVSGGVPAAIVGQFDRPDTGNSGVITAATDPQEFSGTPFDVRGVGAATGDREFIGMITIAVGIDSVTGEELIDLGGTFTFNFASDNGGVPTSPAEISEERPIGTFVDLRDFSLKEAGAWFWIDYTPDRPLVGDEIVVLTTVAHRQTPPPFVRLADQQIEKQNAAMSQAFAYIKGWGLDGVSADVPLGGLDPLNSSQTGLAIDGTFTGTYRKTTGFSSALAFVVSDVELSVTIQWSADGVNPRPGLVGASTVTGVFTSGFWVYLDLLSTMVDQYARLEIVGNDVAATGIFEADLWLFDSPFAGSFGGLDDSLSVLSLSLLTRSVQAGVTPYGAFVNRPEGGEAFRYATNKVDADGAPDPDDPLVADEEIVTPWISAQGHVSLEIFATSDVESAPDGITVEYSPDELIPEVDQYTTPDFFEYRGAAFDSGKFSAVISPRRSFVRLKYKNNSTTAQTRFEFTINLDPTSREMPRTALDAQLNVQSEAITTKGGLVAADNAKNILPIGRDGEGAGALNVHLKAIQDLVEFTLGATTKTRSNQITVSDQNISTIPVHPDIARPKSVRITHPGGEGFPVLYYRSGVQATVTPTNGDMILPSTSVELDYDGSESDIQVILGTPDTPISTEQADIEADTVDSNSGVTDPANMFTAGSGHAVFDAAAQTATISGFDATGSLILNDIGTVLLKVRAKKEAGAAGEVMSYSDPVTSSPSLISSGSTAGGSPIVSPTLLPDSTLAYFVVIARENTGAAVTNVTSDMGFDAYDVTHIESDVNNGAESRHTVIRMHGKPTSAGTISVFLGAASSHDCITVVAVTNFGGVEAVDTDSSGSTGTFSCSAAGTINGLALGVIACELADVTTPVSGFTTREQGGSVANDDQTLWVGTQAISATGSIALSGTTDGGGNDDMTATLLTIIPADAADPVLQVTVNADGGDLPVPLDLTISDETFQEFSLDISGDVAWTKAILDAVTATPNAVIVSNAAAHVDRIWIQAEASSNALRIGYTWVGD